MSRRQFTITKLADDAGYWTARVTCEGVAYEVDRKFGSWQCQADEHTRTEVPAEVAKALQEKVRPIERARVRSTVAGAA